jgi:hypothetical protein
VDNRHPPKQAARLSERTNRREREVQVIVGFILSTAKTQQTLSSGGSRPRMNHEQRSSREETKTGVWRNAPGRSRRTRLS